MAELCVYLVPLFNASPANDQMRMEELVHHQNYQSGELVMDPILSNSLVIVTHGGVHLYTLDENGRGNIIQILGTGDYAGEDRLSGETNINTYAGTTENNDICLLNRSDFLVLMEKRPELSIQLLEQSIIKVYAIHKQIQLLSLSKVED